MSHCSKRSCALCAIKLKCILWDCILLRRITVKRNINNILHFCDYVACTLLIAYSTSDTSYLKSPLRSSEEYYPDNNIGFEWAGFAFVATGFIYCHALQVYFSDLVFWSVQQTSAQDKSSSVVLWNLWWIPPPPPPTTTALRTDLLDVPLSLCCWGERSCTFSSLKKTPLPGTDTDAFSAFEKSAFVPGNSYQSLVFLFICLFLDLKSLRCSD